MAPKIKAPIERFWALVEIRGDNECWEWRNKPKNPKQYPKFRIDNVRHTSAHIASWMFAFGQTPVGYFICHKCDNPSCVNPNHLFLGLPADNSKDMVAKRRSATGSRHGSHIHPERRAAGMRNGKYTKPQLTPRGERHYKAKLSELDVRAILGSQETSRALARRYGVNHRTIGSIRKGRIWRHVTSDQIRGSLEPEVVSRGALNAMMVAL